MDVVAANLVQSPVSLRRTSGRSILLTPSCPGFIRFGSGPQFHLRYNSSLKFSKPMQSRTISLKSRRSFVVKASSASGDASTGSIAPLQLKSPVGQFLSEILMSHPHLVPAVIDNTKEREQNTHRVLDRGEKIELLVDKTENLRSQYKSSPVCK